MCLGIISSVLGLILVLIAGLFLLPKIFITNKELSDLSELPIEPSTTNLTGKTSGKNLPVAVTDVLKLIIYKKEYIYARRKERKNGEIGLYFLVGGSTLQVLV